MVDDKDKDKKNDGAEEELKNLFREFLTEWKANKEKKGKEPENVPVPPPEPKKDDDGKKEKKSGGFLDWLF